MFGCLLRGVSHESQFVLVTRSSTCRSLMFEMTDSGCYHGDTMFVTVLECQIVSY